MKFEVDTRSVEALSRRLRAVAQDSPRAFKQAIQSVSRIAKTEAKRASAGPYNVAQGRVADGLVIRSTDDSVVIRGSKRPLTLCAFGARQTRAGVVVTVFRQAGRKLIRKGFSPAKFNGVPFARSGESRYPIRALTGPSVADMLNNESVSKPFGVVLSDRAKAEIDRRISRELARRG